MWLNKCNNISNGHKLLWLDISSAVCRGEMVQVLECVCVYVRMCVCVYVFEGLVVQGVRGCFRAVTWIWNSRRVTSTFKLIADMDNSPTGARWLDLCLWKQSRYMTIIHFVIYQTCSELPPELRA